MQIKAAAQISLGNITASAEPPRLCCGSTSLPPFFLHLREKYYVYFIACLSFVRGEYEVAAMRTKP